MKMPQYHLNQTYELVKDHCSVPHRWFSYSWFARTSLIQTPKTFQIDKDALTSIPCAGGSAGGSPGAVTEELALEILTVN